MNCLSRWRERAGVRGAGAMLMSLGLSPRNSVQALQPKVFLPPVALCLRGVGDRRKAWSHRSYVTFKGARHGPGNNPFDRSDLDLARCHSDLASQQILGLWPQRCCRRHPGGSSHHGFDGQAVARQWANVSCEIHRSSTAFSRRFRPAHIAATDSQGATHGYERGSGQKRPARR